MRHQRGMCPSHLSFIRLDGENPRNGIDESLTFCPMLRVSERDADEELREGHGSHGYIVLVLNDLVQ